MRSPGRKRPLRRQLCVTVAQETLDQAAAGVLYVGSAEHKVVPTFAGPPTLRSDATPCPPDMKDQALLTGWLKAAIVAGRVGEYWEHLFPRYVWVEHDGQWFEGRLTNSGLGHYKGYPLLVEELPRGLG